MDSAFKQSLWKQFGAAIDMLENAVGACPDDLWDTDSKFWYKAYHTLFFLDYYLSEEPEKFLPPAPFTLSELEPDVMPGRVYNKEELLIYAAHCRQKCHNLIAGLTAETATKRWANAYRDYSLPEILLYNMRHVQHHTGQLNMLLSQNKKDAPGWVSQTKTDL